MPAGVSPEVMPCRWGWIAVMHCKMMSGPWCMPREAARAAGVSTARLREWSDKALISAVILGERQHRRYYLPEIEEITHIAGGLGATTSELEKHIAQWTRTDPTSHA